VVHAREWWLFIKKPLRVGVPFLEAIIYLLIRAVVGKAVGVKTLNLTVEYAFNLKLISNT